MPGTDEAESLVVGSSQGQEVVAVVSAARVSGL